MRAADAIVEILKREGTNTLFCFPTTSIIENAVAAMHAGAADYLAKPFEPERLLQLVHRYRLHAPRASKTVAPGASLDMKSLERKHIMDTLRAVNGSRKQAIARLGISERTLRYKLQRYRLELTN